VARTQDGAKGVTKGCMISRCLFNANRWWRDSVCRVRTINPQGGQHYTMTLFYHLFCSFWACGTGSYRSLCRSVGIMGLAENYRTMFGTHNCCGLLMSVLEGFGWGGRGCVPQAIAIFPFFKISVTISRCIMFSWIWRHVLKNFMIMIIFAFSALTSLVDCKEGHPTRKTWGKVEVGAD